MGLRYSITLDPKDVTEIIYGCSTCRTHLSSSKRVISKDYRGRTGDAYLVEEVVNVTEGTAESRFMVTGMYIVCDIACHQCGSNVGWKYLVSEEGDQKYKEGKYILELKTITNCS